MDNDHLAIDDRLAVNVEGSDDDRKTLCPVQPIAGENALLSSVDVDLDAVAVVLDFVQPIAPWSFTLEGRELGLDKFRHFLDTRHNLTHSAWWPSPYAQFSQS